MPTDQGVGMWSKPVADMSLIETLLLADRLGYPARSGDHATTAARAFAAGLRLYDRATDKVWLGDGPMPEVRDAN